MKKIYLIAVIFAIMAGFATYFFATQIEQKATAVVADTVTVVIAKTNIPENTIVKANMFITKSLPVASVSYGSVAKVDDIVGRMTTSKILTGEQVLADKFEVVGEEDKANVGRLSYELKPGTYAYTISVDTLNSVSGNVRPGDYIDIYDMTRQGQATLLLEHVYVIKVSNLASNQEAESHEAEILSYSDLTVVLTKEQVATLAPVSSYKIVLVSYADALDLESDLPAEGDSTVAWKEIQTNYGMGMVNTTAAPTTAQ